MRRDKFIQPVDGIEIVSRAPRVRAALTDDQLAELRRRIALGEDAGQVATDFGIQATDLKDKEP